MRTKLIEATNLQNWGKFFLCVFDDEDIAYRSKVDGNSLLAGRGFYNTKSGIMVMDLQTKEGAIFMPREEVGFDTVKYDLENHRIWVCPMYEYFLRWLYKQPKEKIYALDLPELVNLDTDFFAIYGYRRQGPEISLDEKRDRLDRVAELVLAQMNGPTATKVDLFNTIRSIVLGEK